MVITYLLDVTLVIVLVNVFERQNLLRVLYKFVNILSDIFACVIIRFARQLFFDHAMIKI